MNVLIDAWLERHEPKLRVIDKDSGEIVEEVAGANLGAFLDRHGLAFEDLLRPETHQRAGLGESALRDDGGCPFASPCGTAGVCTPLSLEVLSTLGHELRNPLNAILGYGQLLARDDDVERSPKLARYTEQILTAARQMFDLIDGELDLARLKSGCSPLDIQIVALSAVVRPCLDLIRVQAEERAIVIEDRTGTDRLPPLLADPRRLRQILSNLLANAVKFNKIGGTIRVAAEPRDGAVRVSVTDTGPGIAETDHDRLFVPFERLGADRAGIPGTGLGLAITRDLVEAMGGRIGLTSRPGVGSTFWVDLPCP